MPNLEFNRKRVVPHEGGACVVYGIVVVPDRAERR